MSNVLTKQEMDLFELIIRDTMNAQQKRLGFSDETLGKMAFPFMAAPRMKVQAIRSVQGKGENRKPQQLRISDVCNLCEALGLNWVGVCREALKAVKAAGK